MEAHIAKEAKAEEARQSVEFTLALGSKEEKITKYTAMCQKRTSDLKYPGREI